MLSPSYDVSEVFSAIRGKDFQEALYLVEQEATAAERLAYRTGDTGEPIRYADTLKAAIQFLRYGVKRSVLDDAVLILAEPIRDSAIHSRQ